jgi:hypothetical protein
VDEHTTRLRALATDVLGVYARRTRPDAVLLAGSAATGGADEHSDLDLLLYYETLPDDETVDAARGELDGTELRLIAPRSESGLIEQFRVDGVVCQVGHLSFADVEGDIRRVAVDLDPDPLAMKAIGGLHEGVPLAGAETIERWRREAAYTDELQRAIVARHRPRIVPLWRLHDHVEARDALIWRQQILVDAALDLLAILASVNRVWFSSFQFKRLRKLVDRLDEAPPDLAERLESLFLLEPRAAAEELQRLVDETDAVLAAHGLST